MAPILNDLNFYFYKHNLFYRGAIGYGKYERDESTFIFPVIDNVASWYEAAVWIGTILTPVTNYIYDRFENMEVNINNFSVNPYIKYLVPGPETRLMCGW